MRTNRNGDPGCDTTTGRQQDLNCPTSLKGLFDLQRPFGELSNRTALPDKKRSAGLPKETGASENDRLGGAIEEGDSPLAAQENIFELENIPREKSFELRRGRAKSIAVAQNGAPRPRSARPIEIRQHVRIRDKRRRQPCYYSRWYRCKYADCRTTLVMPEEHKIWNVVSPDLLEAIQEPQQDETCPF